MGLLGHGDSFVLRDPSGIRPHIIMKMMKLFVASERPVIQKTVFEILMMLRWL
jgi:amidophosphoribosyltransferase